MACDTKDCGFQMLNDDEIMTSVQESDPVDDETDGDEDNNSNERSKDPSNADTFSAGRIHPPRRQDGSLMISSFPAMSLCWKWWEHWFQGTLKSDWLTRKCCYSLCDRQL
ncbi:hypothetical protein TNCV_1538331 [Trichonephila clavipes]|nr:hypothetical protein TNCV_1538331 [Trichonephila clavipes]